QILGGALQDSHPEGPDQLRGVPPMSRRASERNAAMTRAAGESTAGVEARLDLAAASARVNSCPDTKPGALPEGAMEVSPGQAERSPGKRAHSKSPSPVRAAESFSSPSAEGGPPAQSMTLAQVRAKL